MNELDIHAVGKSCFSQKLSRSADVAPGERMQVLRSTFDIGRHDRVRDHAAAAAARGVYVLIEAAVGGGIPIIEPLKQSLGGNRIQRVSGIINGTTNYILSRMADEGAAYGDVLADARPGVAADAVGHGRDPATRDAMLVPAVIRERSCNGQAGTRGAGGA